MINNPKFTVIIPIYNAEKFIAETIDSVVNQTIGFRENIHMVLVNDGSKDSSEAICLKYAEEFPENIEYVFQENQGVAVARNTGLDHVRGKYVNLLDADDKWTPDAFQKGYDFFEKNYDEVDFIATRVKQFGRDENYHLLDYKFSSDRIVDIQKEYNCIQLFLNSAFFKAEALKDIRFHINSKISQDIPFVNEVILQKGKYGIMRSVEYLYRKDAGQTSSIDNGMKREDFYLKVTGEIYPFLFNLSIEKYGEIIPYVQALVAYDLQWKLTTKGVYPPCMDEAKQQKFIQLMKDAYSKIEPKYILEQKSLSTVIKTYALHFRNPENPETEMIANYVKFRIFKLEADDQNKNIIIEGRGYTEYLNNEYSIQLIDGSGRKCKLTRHHRTQYDWVDVYGNTAFKGITYSAELPIENNEKYKIKLINKKTKQEIEMPIVFAKEINLNKHNYKCLGNSIVTCTNKSISVRRKTLMLLLKRKRQYRKFAK